MKRVVRPREMPRDAMHEEKGWPLVVGITGASGAIYAIRALEELQRQSIPVDLVVSPLGARLLWEEISVKPRDLVQRTVRLHAVTDLGADISTGSYRTRGMLIIPATTGTVGRIAAGTSDNLLVRAADVTLKERRKLVIVCRETPLSLVHLRAMTALAEAGAVILPACPGFYHKPRAINDLVDFVVARALAQFDIVSQHATRYRDQEASE